MKQPRYFINFECRPGLGTVLIMGVNAGRPVQHRPDATDRYARILNGFHHFF
jgi:hypothetical protein